MDLAKPPLYKEITGNIDDTPGKMAVSVTFKTPTEAIPVRGPATEQGFCTPNELIQAMGWDHGVPVLFRCNVEKVPGGGVTLVFTEVSSRAAGFDTER